MNGTPLLVEGREYVNGRFRLQCDARARLRGNLSSYLRVGATLTDSKKGDLAATSGGKEGNCATYILPALQA